ncbi:kelch-like protein 9 [Plakobranchus ocellatus]|uniref:Kelch-like protein 9 n=1 Tax=Plakobranchus ocellatus TaxID=259542 RepID=A0AAV4A1B6_9GAST|nr:kelch-like protein 9 [Plakobranchus ocellatus]
MFLIHTAGTSVMVVRVYDVSYIGGERSDGKITATSEVYDPATDTWSRCGMLLAPRANCACAGYGSEILCAGGFHGGAAHNNLWIYEDHRWQEMDEDYPHLLPCNLDKCAIATVGSTFYFIGGVASLEVKQKPQNDKNYDLNNSNHIDHNYYSSNNVHNKFSNSADTRRIPATSKSVEKNQRKVRFQTQRRMFSYTTQISAGDKTRHGQQPDLISPWNFKLPPMIHARHSAGAVAVGHKIHVVGGTSVETGQTIRVSETFDLVKGIWEEDFTLRKYCAGSCGKKRLTSVCDPYGVSGKTKVCDEKYQCHADMMLSFKKLSRAIGHTDFVKILLLGDPAL